MTRKSDGRKKRDRQSFPPADQVAALQFNNHLQKYVIVKRNMLTNQIYRDGPTIARSFDKLVKPHITESSDIFSLSSSLMLTHLPNLNDDGFKATSARLLLSASNSYVASIQAARHGYRRQFGILARSMIEALATVMTLAIKPDALVQFHAGTLPSNKCVGWAKAVLEPIGRYYGMLSDEFVHIGKSHSYFEPPSHYKSDEEALPFIISCIRGNAWLLLVVSEFIFHDDVNDSKFWKVVGESAVAYAPNDEVRQWSDDFLNF